MKIYDFRLKFHWSLFPINNIPALVKIMAWRRPGDEPLSEPISAAYRYVVYRITGKNVTIRLPVCPNVWKRYIVSYHFTPKIINFGQLCNVVHTARARRNNLTLKVVFLSIEIWFQTTLPPFSHLVGDFPKQVSARVRSNLWQTEDRYYRDTYRIIVSLIRCNISYRIIVTICSTRTNDGKFTEAYMHHSASIN